MMNNERKVKVDIFPLVVKHKNEVWDKETRWGHYTRRKEVHEWFETKIRDAAKCGDIIEIALNFRDNEAIITLGTRDKSIMWEMMYNLIKIDLFGYYIN